MVLRSSRSLDASNAARPLEVDVNPSAQRAGPVDVARPTRGAGRMAADLLVGGFKVALAVPQGMTAGLLSSARTAMNVPIVGITTAGDATFHGMFNGVMQMRGDVPASDDAAAVEPAPRPVEELNALIAAKNETIEAYEAAHGMRDFATGVLCLIGLPLNAAIAAARAGAAALHAAPGTSAMRARAANTRPSSNPAVAAYESNASAAYGAVVGTLRAPLDAVLIGAQAGLQSVTDDLTTVFVRLPRGIGTLTQLKLGQGDIDQKKIDVTSERDALLMERRRASQLVTTAG